MASVNSNDLKEGAIFKDNGSTYIVLSYEHIKKGRGQATIKVKVKNIESGTITILSYSNEDRVEAADVFKKNAQYLYADDANVYFMDAEDFSQFQIERVLVDSSLVFLKEGDKVIVMFLDERPISIELPKVVELQVTQTSPAVAGNTATGAMKDAVMETGLLIQVPLFIKEGEKLRVNTELKSYVARVN